MKGKLSITYNVILFTFISLVLIACSTHWAVSSNITRAQKHCLEQEQRELATAYHAYTMARGDNGINNTIDSVFCQISKGNSLDTIYMVECCNPPLYTYYAVIWNKSHSLTLYRTGIIEDGSVGVDDRLFNLIESWDKDNIYSKSHEKPLAHYGKLRRTNMCSRIIMKEGKCIKAETICINAINMDDTNMPILFE